MVIFKDRVDAGKKLADFIVKSDFFKKIKNKKNIIVVSLLRGGVVVGFEIAKKIGVKNLPLPVAKISSPENPELAIGALCFSQIYWEKHKAPMANSGFWGEEIFATGRGRFFAPIFFAICCPTTTPPRSKEITIIFFLFSIFLKKSDLMIRSANFFPASTRSLKIIIK